MNENCLMGRKAIAQTGTHVIYISKHFIRFATDPEKGSGLCIEIEPRHVISNNVVCATTKASDQPAHTRNLIRAFASRLNIL